MVRGVNARLDGHYRVQHMTTVVTERGPGRSHGESALARDELQVTASGGLASSVERALREGTPSIRWSWLTTSGGPGGLRAQSSAGHEEVVVDRDTWASFYHDFGAGVLWPALHGLPPDAGALRAPDGHCPGWLDYRSVNASFARALRSGPDPDQPLLVQDYQLLLLPEMVRAAQPDRPIALHVHTPFVPGERWHRLVTGRVGESLLRGMLGAGLISFSSSRWARAFTRQCAELPDVGVVAPDMLELAGKRTVRVATLPVLASPSALERAARASRARAWEASLGDLERAVLVMGRLDPAKNLATALRAVDQLLKADGTACAVVMLIPSSRRHLPAYAACAEEVERLVAELRRRHGPRFASWAGNDVARAYAALRGCGVILVPSVADGMNLVAQEAVWLTRVGAALVLTAGVGAADLLADAADVLADPMNVDAMAAALTRALALPFGVKAAKNRVARRALHEAAARGSWLARQEQLCRN